MAGAFDASSEFDDDPLATAEEIQHSGEQALQWLEAVATSVDPRPVDLELVKETHFRWFETTFPTDAGRFRTEMVLNRKGTRRGGRRDPAGGGGRLQNWSWRREHYRPTDELELIKFIVAEANTLAVRIYDVHPFLDGNTRATWHLRNYALMLDGLRPLVDLADIDRYESVWWTATAEDHDQLDEIVLTELADQQPGE